MADKGAAQTPGEVADYVAEIAGQLALMAQGAGFTQTAAQLIRAQLSALADLRAQARPDDAT